MRQTLSRYDRASADASVPRALLMSFDFDQPVDRRHSGSIKWTRYPPDVLPMWVADMDFRAPPPVLERLGEMVEHGIFGYELPPTEWFDFVCERMERLYGWRISPEMVVATPGVVSGFNIAARASCEPGSGLLMQPPVYHRFLQVHDNIGLQRQLAPLRRQTDGDFVRYSIDFEVLEAAVTADSRMLLLCHPHNPTGQVFSREELTRMAEICLDHDLVICSDEIHSELLLGEARHVPMAAIAPEVEKRTITLIAPSKTFNLAGLFCGFAIIPDAELRRRYLAVYAAQALHVSSVGLAAAKAAFLHGAEWLAALRAYLTANRDALVRFVREQLPGVRTTLPDASYLAWLDCGELDLRPTPHRFLLDRGRLALDDGAAYGPGGEGFVRLNFGCPRSTLMEGLGRMKAAVAGG